MNGADTPAVWAPTTEERLAAAEAERHELIQAETGRHVSNIRSELKRYEDALAHIENVFRLRTEQEDTP